MLKNWLYAKGEFNPHLTGGESKDHWSLISSLLSESLTQCSETKRNELQPLESIFSVDVIAFLEILKTSNSQVRIWDSQIKVNIGNTLLSYLPTKTQKT